MIFRLVLKWLMLPSAVGEESGCSPAVWILLRKCNVLNRAEEGAGRFVLSKAGLVIVTDFFLASACSDCSFVKEHGHDLEQGG
jgi:hypothetical protein